MHISDKLFIQKNTFFLWLGYYGAIKLSKFIFNFDFGVD